MPRPRNADDWTTVETAEDFCAYLTYLSGRCANQDSAYNRQAAAGAWTSITLPQYLHRWANWLQHSRLNADTSRRPEIDPPTWRTFAFQLYSAFTTDTSSTPPEVITKPHWPEVTTAEDFVAHLVWLGYDFLRDEKEIAERRRKGLWAGELDWKSWTISGYLEAWSWWLNSAFLRPDPPQDRSEIDPLTWRACAGQVYIASRYE